jgi:hypothetical protein
MKTPYSLKEKILLASLIHDMEEAIENKKQIQFGYNEKIVFRKGLTLSTIANQRVLQYARPSNWKNCEPVYNTGYFTSDNEPNGIKMRPTLYFRKSWLLKLKCPAFFENILWDAIFIPLGSLSLMK